MEERTCSCGAKETRSIAKLTKRFTDVNTSEWYYSAITYVVGEGMMKGVSDTTFDPDASLSRAMLVQILYNIEGNPGTNATKTFADVARGTWYYDAIMWAAGNGIVMGTSDSTYSPDDNVTREQMVTILYRYFGSPDVSGQRLTFADSARIDAYAKYPVIWASENGVVKGVGNNSFDPDGNCTRAQIAQVMMNIFG